jgi:hypothetical protein
MPWDQAVAVDASFANVGRGADDSEDSSVVWERVKLAKMDEVISERA